MLIGWQFWKLMKFIFNAHFVVEFQKCALLTLFLFVGMGQPSTGSAKDLFCKIFDWFSLATNLGTYYFIPVLVATTGYDSSQTKI